MIAKGQQQGGMSERMTKNMKRGVNSIVCDCLLQREDFPMGPTLTKLIVH